MILWISSDGNATPSKDNKKPSGQFIACGSKSTEPGRTVSNWREALVLVLQHKYTNVNAPCFYSKSSIKFKVYTGHIAVWCMVWYMVLDISLLYIYLCSEKAMLGKCNLIPSFCKRKYD